MRYEKRMRKLLKEEIKARKVHGARIAQGFKSASNLASLQLAPQVFLFKNLFSGQVIYSQVPAYHQDQIDEQFVRPNWENRKPLRRMDLWRIMAVATFPSYQYAIAAYNGLVQLRRARDTEMSKISNEMRRKNDEGNIWYSGQFRPTYSQEAVADLAHVVDEFELENTTIDWESLWRKGSDEHWRLDLVKHKELPTHCLRHQSIMLDDLREKALAEFAKLSQKSVEPSSTYQDDLEFT